MAPTPGLIYKQKQMQNMAARFSSLLLLPQIAGETAETCTDSIASQFQSRCGWALQQPRCLRTSLNYTQQLTVSFIGTTPSCEKRNDFKDRIILLSQSNLICNEKGFGVLRVQLLHYRATPQQHSAQTPERAAQRKQPQQHPRYCCSKRHRLPLLS